MAAYDEMTRVLSVWWGGLCKGGRLVDAYTTNVDMMPTILDLAGVASSYAQEGSSLRGFLTGAKTVKGWRTAFGVEGRWGGSEDGEEVDDDKKSFAIYAPDWRYCQHSGPGITGILEELYDLRPSKSPDGSNARYQLTNVAARKGYEEILIKLRGLCGRYRRFKGARCVITEKV